MKRCGAALSMYFVQRGIQSHLVRSAFHHINWSLQLKVQTEFSCH
jgi:hypothetical protein